MRMENRGYQNRLGKDRILTVFSSPCEIGSAVRLSSKPAWSFTARDRLWLRMQLCELADAPAPCRKAWLAPMSPSHWRGSGPFDRETTRVFASIYLLPASRAF